MSQRMTHVMYTMVKTLCKTKT